MRKNARNATQMGRENQCGVKVGVEKTGMNMFRAWLKTWCFGGNYCFISHSGVPSAYSRRRAIASSSRARRADAPAPDGWMCGG
jgi:hypothetical protein